MRNMFHSAAMLLLLASTVFADISSVNTRPVVLGAAPGSELTLQEMLDLIYGPGTKSAANDQETTGIWQLPGGVTGATVPILQFEQTSNANSNVFGIWSGTDLNVPPIMAPIFTGAAAPGTEATLKWLTGSPNTVQISSSSPGVVNTGTFVGINRSWFGFYMQTGAGTFFTADQLNGGTARALTFRETNQNLWTLAFEDGTDNDFNDLVVTAESIVPAPDGGTTVLLLGGALLGLETFRRRFRV